MNQHAVGWPVYAVLLTIGLAGGSSVVWSQEAPPLVARLLDRVPRTEIELTAAHAASVADAVQVAAGDPLEEAGFSGRTVSAVLIDEAGQPMTRQIEFDYSRLAVTSIAMHLLPGDQERLPVVSRQRIVKRVDENYLVIQVRVQRDAAGQVYLHHRPIAAVGKYGADDAQEFAPLMESSVQDVRGIGLWVPPGSKLGAESLRTMVAINRDVYLTTPAAGEPAVARPHYELMFVRARFDGLQPVLHCFVTNENRERLNYLRGYQPPLREADCDLRNTIYFTEYTQAKQSPSKKVTREVRIMARASYLMSDLDRWSTAQGWSGSALDNLTALLDAVIDGSVAISTPAEVAPATVVLPAVTAQQVAAPGDVPR